MTADSESVAKHTPPIPGYLCEQMTVGRMVEALEALHFNKREQASLVLDPGVQAFLIRATKAAAILGQARATKLFSNWTFTFLGRELSQSAKAAPPPPPDAETPPSSPTS